MIRLEIDGKSFGRISIDGQDIGGAISEVTIVAKVGQPTRTTANGSHGAARIEIGMPVLAMIDEGYGVRLRERDRAALLALGWTPPSAPVGSPEGADRLRAALEDHEADTRQES